MRKLIIVFVIATFLAVLFSQIALAFSGFNFFVYNPSSIERSDFEGKKAAWFFK